MLKIAEICIKIRGEIIHAFPFCDFAEHLLTNSSNLSFYTMKKVLLFIACMAMISCSGCSGNDPKQPEEKEERPILTDSKATNLAKALYSNMYGLMDKGTMFGAQIPTLYGLDNNKKWYADGAEYNSDTKYLTGSHPAVCGWELSGIELGNALNIDNEDFNQIRTHIIAAYQRGAINTISWHCANPVSGGTAWDGTRAVYSVLEGGVNHEKFLGWLDKVADFMKTLKTPEGELIPIIFRPWHEHTGAGFWWGKGNCSQPEFVEFWQMTVNYLRDEKGLHNLIWAYSPDMCHLSSRDDYMEYWPGDEFVDILGLDAYDRDGEDYGHRGLQMVRMANVIAKEKNKFFALTETGLESNNPETSAYYNKKWWTMMLHHIIDGQRVAFALVWRNGGFPSEGSHYFNAFRGCYSEDDFLQFAAKDNVLFENDLPDMYR